MNVEKLHEVAPDPAVLQNLRADLGLGSYCDSKSPDVEPEPPKSTKQGKVILD